MKKPLYLFLLVFVVFLSGCLNQSAGPSAGTNGVVIQNFKTDLTEVEPGMPVILSFTVKNIGGVKATSVSAELIGLTKEWSISPDRKQSISDLLPADPERGITEGQEDYKEWRLTPPGKNVKLTYDVNARVYYTYATVSESLLRAVTYDYFRQTQERGGVETTKATGGPLSVIVKAPSTIISGGQVMIQFEIQNVGGGRAYKSGYTTPTLETLDVIQADVRGADCGGTKDVRLVDGKTGRLYCKVSTGSVTNFQDFTISLTLNYRYYVESKTTISVLPAVEGITPTAPGIPVTPTEGIWLFWNFKNSDVFNVGDTYRITYYQPYIRLNVTNLKSNHMCDVVFSGAGEKSINVRSEGTTYSGCNSGAELILKIASGDIRDLSSIKCSNCYSVLLVARNDSSSDTKRLAILPNTYNFDGYKITLKSCKKGGGGGWESAHINVSSTTMSREVIEAKVDNQYIFPLDKSIYVRVYEITGKQTGEPWDYIEGDLCRIRIKTSIETAIPAQ